MATPLLAQGVPGEPQLPWPGRRQQRPPVPAALGTGLAALLCICTAAGLLAGHGKERGANELSQLEHAGQTPFF